MKITARQARDAAIAEVDANADYLWKLRAWKILIKVARSKPFFTTNDLWRAGLPRTREHRALGPIMLKAAKRKIASKTDRTQVTSRVVAHERPMAVWQSLVYGR